MTTTDPAPDVVDMAGRLRSLVFELDRLLADGPALAAAVNPDGTPGNVAAGELIESAWGNATANTLRRLADADVDATIPITGPVDVVNSGMADWLVGAITVPAWATKVRLVTTLSGIYQASGTGSAFELQTRVGPAAGLIAFHQPPSNTSRATLTWNDTVAISSTGAINIAVMARRSIGDGVLRADTACTCRFTARFDW